MPLPLSQPAEQEVHLILDNFSTHKTDLVKGASLFFTESRARVLSSGGIAVATGRREFEYPPGPPDENKLI